MGEHPRWRVLEYRESDAAMNMAVDEAISEAVRDGISAPTIRFYGWDPPAVSIGYFQCIRSEIDLDACLSWGVDPVRRRTGGGAVFHDRGGEFTYSVIADENLFPSDILASYREICSWVTASLSLIGIESEFKPINDIIVNGRKISGNAQTRREGVLLQHGTILYSVDVGRMFSVLKVPDEKIRDKMISSAKERVTSISQQRSVSWETAYGAILGGFTKGKRFDLGELSGPEKRRSLELADSRYRSPAWNMMR